VIKTSNIYYAGYLLTENAEIVNVETAINGKSQKYVLFHFSTGDKETDKQIEKEYERRKAQSNIRQYIDNLVRVRDIVHSMKEMPGETNGCKRDKQYTFKN